MPRASIGKRSRFEIFKRDKFACQYCGRTPPSVILEIDHIAPVSKGGKSDSINLITACFDCNRGKADIPLNQIPPSLDSQIQEQKDRRKQVLAYNKFLLSSRKADEAEIVELGKYWYNQFREQNKYCFGQSRQISVKTFLKHMAQAEIMDAMDIAISRQRPNGDDDDRTFRYFCGVCWKIIKEKDG